MIVKFTSIYHEKPGIIASLLSRSYSELNTSEPEYLESEIRNWHQFDKEAFENPETVGRCIFLSWAGDNLVGFASFDPRREPEYGIIGHNCILPEFRRNGFGKQQILEILRKFQKGRIKTALVSTTEHYFFLPARQMYISCGFKESRKYTDKYKMIEYQKRIG